MKGLFRYFIDSDPAPRMYSVSHPTDRSAGMHDMPERDEAGSWQGLNGVSTIDAGTVASFPGGGAAWQKNGLSEGNRLRCVVSF